MQKLYHCYGGQVECAIDCASSQLLFRRGSAQIKIVKYDRAFISRIG